MRDNTKHIFKSNISKKVRGDIVFTGTLFKEYSIAFLLLWRLIDFAQVVVQLLMSEELLASENLGFSIFPILKGLNKIKKKIKDHLKPPKLVIQSLFK